MGKIFLAVLAFVVGLVIGALGALSIGGGAMMGAGIGTGLVSGVCMVVEAAEQTGLLTPEQIDQVLARAAENASGAALPEGTDISGNAAECAEALKELRGAK